MMSGTSEPLLTRFPSHSFHSFNVVLIGIVFDLPQDLLATLQPKDPSTLQSHATVSSTAATRAEESSHGSELGDESLKTSTSCFQCGVSFQNLGEQRRHAKSDWHAYNLKQKLRGGKLVTENEFEKLLESLEESISGSELSDSYSNEEQKDDTLTALLKKQAKITQSGQEVGADAEDWVSRRKKKGPGVPPLIWFSTPTLPTNTSLGIYRSIFTKQDLEGESNIVDVLRQRQLSHTTSKTEQSHGSNGASAPSAMTSPQIFLCMIGGGHFAAMIVSLAPKMGKKSSGAEERQAVVVAHKTFHRYTTRRKQGGSQSANDSAKGAAHSAGASIRRYNEAALENEIRVLLAEWKNLIEKCQLIFIRATGSTNRRTLFGPYEGQVLHHNDARNRSFPFNTRRATQAELMRAFVELTRVKVSRVDEAAMAAAAAAADAERETLRANPTKASPRPIAPSPSKDEEESSLHTSQLQALIRRSKIPALLAYLSTNSLPADFRFYPSNSQAHHHTPTPLHFAASINSSTVVLALLVKAHSNPTITNSDGHPPFDLTGDRATRDAFRVARSELGEARWDWVAAHCPPPLSKVEADQRRERDRAQAEREEVQRRKTETEKLKREEALGDEQQSGKKPARRVLGTTEKTAEERREEEARGLTPELRMRLERERRARAAEERIKRMTGGGSGTDSGGGGGSAAR